MIWIIRAGISTILMILASKTWPNKGDDAQAAFLLLALSMHAAIKDHTE